MKKARGGFISLGLSHATVYSIKLTGGEIIPIIVNVWIMIIYSLPKIFCRVYSLSEPIISQQTADDSTPVLRAKIKMNY